MRARGVRAVLAAALVTCLLLGGAVLLVANRQRASSANSLDHPVRPLGDAATEAQVVDKAKQIVKIAGLQTTAAGYLLMSCKNRDDPPYQGAVYLTFALPAEVRADAYFRDVTAALVRHGWTEGLPPNDQVFGRTMSTDGVTAIIYRHGDDTGAGVLRLYGQCRNVNDHRRDTTAWVDITSQFGAGR
ncbi:Putative lipoprotein LppJ [Mycobacterium innocens]|uniref:Lipoprotein LppJ n=1 Tax=Mycobacterium innocens TaxID=2341083 RepID=A0A498Q5T6_9MYCO|nr:Putative lipoprotein LppJ [Mycobacterium innocens]